MEERVEDVGERNLGGHGGRTYVSPFVFRDYEGGLLKDLRRVWR